MNQVPGLEPECRVCEDWGTVVQVDDRGMSKGIDFCACAKGREERLKASAFAKTSV